MEVSPEEFVENLKNHPAGHELARMIFGVISEEKFLSLHQALMPLNDGPLDHLLNETQCKELLLKRFMKDDVIAFEPCKPRDVGLEGYQRPFMRRSMCVLKGFSIEKKYKEFIDCFQREPNLSGIAWILEQKVRRIALSDKLQKWATDSSLSTCRNLDFDPPKFLVFKDSDEVIWQQHTYVLEKRPLVGFGFAIRGGIDNPSARTGDTSVKILTWGKLQVNDQLLQVNSMSMENVTLVQATDFLRKKAGRRVELTVKRKAIEDSEDFVYFDDFEYI